MSWHYLREQEEEFWEGSCLDGAPCALLRLIPTVAKSYSRDKETGSLSRFRSGTTCGRLTGGNGEGVSTSLVEGFRVRTLVAREKVPGSTASVPGSGLNLPGSLARWDRDTCSLRTAQCLLFEEGTELLQILPRWGFLRDGGLFPLPTPERLIYANGSGYGQRFPTPTADDAKSGRNLTANRSDPNSKHHSGTTLTDFVTLFPTPTANRWNGLQSHGVNVISGALNPEWVEWLMGWPLGWTDLGRLGTGRFREWLRLHGGCWEEENE